MSRNSFANPTARYKLFILLQARLSHSYFIRGVLNRRERAAECHPGQSETLLSMPPHATRIRASEYTCRLRTNTTAYLARNGFETEGGENVHA